MPLSNIKLDNNVSIRLARHSNVRELETVDLPVYIRGKSVTFYRHLLL